MYKNKSIFIHLYLFHHILTEASLFERNKWSRYGSPLFLNFRLILLKSAHDIRVANIEHRFLNKIFIHEYLQGK
jgi:hypothetical protein